MNNINKRDAAGAACRNAAAQLEDMAVELRRTCLSAFREPAEVPVEAVLALNDIENASRLLGEAADIFYEDADVEAIEAMRRIREQAAHDAAERERRKAMDKLKCPLCGQEYTGRPALSREDNRTLICPDCGTRQALTAIGVAKDKHDAVIALIHEYEARRAQEEKA